MQFSDRKRELGTLSDVLLAVLAYLMVVDWHLGSLRVGTSLWYEELIPIIVGVWWLLSAGLRHDVPYRLHGFAVEVRETLAVNVVGGALVVCLAELTRHAVTSRLVLIAFPAMSATFAISFRFMVRGILAFLRRRGRDLRQLLVVGPHDASRRLASAMASPDSGLRVLGVLVPPGGEPDHASALPVLGNYGDLEDVLHSCVVDRIAVTAPIDDPGLRRIVDTAIREGKSVWLMLDAFGARLVGQGRASHMVVLSPEHDDATMWLKRALDVVCSVACLVLVSPVLAACAVAIKLETPSAPVIFRQRRVGLHGRQFMCLKFRSMVPGAESRRALLQAMNEMDGPVFKMRNDPRITGIGRFLRKYSLDELPQLWNVLMGDMSLVGPRPPLPDEVRQYEPDFRRRLAFRPGLTCLWQVSGRNQVDFAQWMALDLQYVDNWSLWLDIQILLRTIPTILFGSGM